MLLYTQKLFYICLLNKIRKFCTEERTGKEVRCRYGLLYPDVAYMPDRLLFNETNEQVGFQQDTFMVAI